jgi:hypothetical protein
VVRIAESGGPDAALAQPNALQGEKDSAKTFGEFGKHQRMDKKGEVNVLTPRRKEKPAAVKGKGNGVDMKGEDITSRIKIRN